MKRLVDKMVEIILRIGITFVNILPLKISYIFGKWLARIVFFIWRGRRRVIIENLKLAFGDRNNKKEIKKLYKEIIENIGKGFMETIKFRTLSDSFFNNNINIIGISNLKDAINKGKGVIAVSAHLGNFTLIGRKLAMLGYKFNYINRDPHNKGVAEIFKKIRKYDGVNFIPDKPKNLCLKKSIDCLKNGEILFIQIDINVASGGIFVDFFGHKVPTFKGPVTLSMRSGAPVLPMFIVRDNNNIQNIIVEPPVNIFRNGDIEEDIYRNTYNIVKIIEDYIRRYPTQWWWIHRRWKRKKNEHKLSDGLKG
jgi:KDO2-lipid IV(A) lauroyltransferase